MPNEPEQLGPHNRLHQNVFELASGSLPIKLGGKTVGTGKLQPDGSIVMEIFDEDAKTKLADGSVGSLSVDNTSHTITAIMDNRKRKEI